MNLGIVNESAAPAVGWLVASSGILETFDDGLSAVSSDSE